MNCLSCGCDSHIRADGSCMQHRCPKKIEKWETPEVKRVPLSELKDMQPPDESPNPPKADVEAAAPNKDAK